MRRIQKSQAFIDELQIVGSLLPAVVKHPPVTVDFFGLICMLLELVRPPPDINLSVRYRLGAVIDEIYGGRDVFDLLSSHRYQFYNLCGETPETFLDLLGFLNIRHRRCHVLSYRNRLLLVLIWLRSYPTYMVLSSLFNVTVTTVKEEIRLLLPGMFLKLKRFVTWPSEEEWLEMRGSWKEIPSAVGAIDGTPHQINRPRIEPQEQYYSGHRKYHAIHSQVVVDCGGTVRHIKCGFLGHQNDAQQYHSMTEIGTDLPFPPQCILFGDKIYPNNETIMTPYTSAQLRLKTPREKRKCAKLNRLIRKYRVCVENTIGVIKTYRSISSVWRQKRTFLPRVVFICCALYCRKKKSGVLM